MLPLSLPFPWHSNFPSLMSPGGTGSSWPTKGRGMSSPLRDARRVEATCSCAPCSQEGHAAARGWTPAGGKALPQVSAVVQQPLQLCSRLSCCPPSTCLTPAPTGSSRPLPDTPRLFVSWKLAHLGKGLLRDCLSWILGISITKNCSKVKNLL